MEIYMKVIELYNSLSELYPRTLSCPWDNDGIMFSCDTEREVGRVLVSLDATSAAVSYAAERGFDVLVTHHPMIFRGVKSVTPDSASGNRILLCAENSLSVISLHTRLDAGDGGVNDCLCEALGFSPAEKFGDNDSPALARIVECGGISGDELACLVKERLGCRAVRVTGEGTKTVHRIALCGGDGKDLIPYALGCGCDAFITGDAGYNMAEDAAECGLFTVEAGHYHTEAPVCAALCGIIGKITGTKPEIYDSCAYSVL